MGLTQAMPFGNMANGWTVYAEASATPASIPLLGVTYDTGTVTTVAGDSIITGDGTTFTTAHVGLYCCTAGGYVYQVTEFISTTALRIAPAVATAEAGVAYSLYARPKTAVVYIKAKSDNTGNIFVGVRGVLATTGWKLDAGDAMPELKVDLSQTDLWLMKDDADTGETIHWAYLW